MGNAFSHIVKREHELCEMKARSVYQNNSRRSGTCGPKVLGDRSRDNEVASTCDGPRGDQITITKNQAFIESVSQITPLPFSNRSSFGTYGCEGTKKSC